MGLRAGKEPTLPLARQARGHSLGSHHPLMRLAAMPEPNCLLIQDPEGDARDQPSDSFFL